MKTLVYDPDYSDVLYDIFQKAGFTNIQKKFIKNEYEEILGVQFNIAAISSEKQQLIYYIESNHSVMSIY